MHDWPMPETVNRPPLVLGRVTIDPTRALWAKLADLEREVRALRREIERLRKSLRAA